MARNIDSSEDMLDSRDVQERIAELETEIADLEPDEENEFADQDLVDELELLQQLKEAVEGVTSEWDDGAQIIAESAFKDYAKELVIGHCGLVLIEPSPDCGYFSETFTEGAYGKRVPIDWDRWPYKHIDWDGVAEDLKADYSEITWDGEIFWVRDS